MKNPETKKLPTDHLAIALTYLQRVPAGIETRVELALAYKNFREHTDDTPLHKRVEEWARQNNLEFRYASGWTPPVPGVEGVEAAPSALDSIKLKRRPADAHPWIAGKSDEEVRTEHFPKA